MSGKTAGRKGTIALSMLVVVLIALLGLLYHSYSTALSSKDLQISSLTSENEELRRRVGSLEGALRERESATPSLASENSALKEEVGRLQRNLSNLLSMYEGLRKRYEELSAEQAVSREPLALSPLFAKFDLDGDGALSWQESKTSIQRSN
jgi:cell shape-determining protein MreC